MNGKFRTARAVTAVLIAIATAGPAFAQKPGGVLKMPHFDSPASMSILEEATRATVQPMMGVFNNLVLYDLGERYGPPASCAAIETVCTGRDSVLAR